MSLYYPLDGVRVVALEQYIAAPYCTMWLADAGAEVIKIERPGTGDPRRDYRPVIEEHDGGKLYGGFLAYNRNKKSLAVDIQTADGKGIYRELVRRSDVVVENLKPGTAEKLGVGYEALRAHNPRLVYAAISGFGRLPEFSGPYSERPVFDAVIQAMSGIMELVGDKDGPPLLALPGLADLFTGVVTAYEIMLALFMRDRMGEGQFIDSSMYDSLVALNERVLMLHAFTGEVLSRGQERYQAPMGAFKVKDGWVALITPNDVMWARFCEALGRKDLIDDARTATGPQRARNEAYWGPIINGWMAGRTKDEVFEVLNRHGVPVGPVQTAEDLARCPHLAARRALVELDDPRGGKLRVAKAPVRMSKTREAPTHLSPRLGEHTESLLRDILGYDAARIAELRQAGAIQ